MRFDDWMTTDNWPDPIDLRTDRPHPARVYDYLLGGKNNFPADRDAADAAFAVFPAARTAARANREFMHRAVRHLATDAGIRQFLDVGTGIPLSPNVHEIAQRIDPTARVVYVDNDPIVLAHARALLTGAPQGVTEYLDADFLDTERILAGARQILDFDQPIGLLLIALTHFFADDQDPHGVVARLVDALPSGSYLALTNGTADILVEQVGAAANAISERGMPVHTRPRDEVTRFFTGLDLVDPGLVRVHHWRPEDPADLPEDADVPVYGAVARKP